MNENERPPEEAEQTIDAPPDEIWENEDWIGEIGSGMKGLKDEMADVAREADEGMVDGSLGKALVFLKRYWAVILVALLPMVPGMIEHWAENDPFAPVPELITQAELQEISDYVVGWTAQYNRPMNLHTRFDLNGDGEKEAEVYAFLSREPEREELWWSTSLELPTLWQVITGKHPLAPAQEEMSFQDDQACIIFTVTGPTAGDRSEMRQTVEATLTMIRQDNVEE